MTFDDAMAEHVTSFPEMPNGSLMKSFLDIIVLAMLNGNPVHGYKVIAELHRSFGVLLSPGTLYPRLYSLQKEKLIDVMEDKRRKLYFLTPEGRKRVSTVNQLFKRDSEKIFKFIESNLSRQIE